METETNNNMTSHLEDKDVVGSPNSMLTLRIIMHGKVSLCDAIVTCATSRAIDFVTVRVFRWIPYMS